MSVHKFITFWYFYWHVLLASFSQTNIMVDKLSPENKQHCYFVFTLFNGQFYLSYLITDLSGIEMLKFWFLDSIFVIIGAKSD